MYYFFWFIVLLIPESTLGNTCSDTYNKITSIIQLPCKQNFYGGFMKDENGITRNCYKNEEDYSWYYDDVEETVINSTITCSGLYSTLDISYHYREETYDQFLKIISSNISTLEPAAFLTFTTITKLYLSENYIETIKPAAFNILSNLRELYLDKNNISKISNGVFNHLYKLEILNLGNNKIHNIDELAFMGLTNLSTLYLNNNKLAIIEQKLFETQENLKYLDLSANPLKVLSVEGLSNLHFLVVKNGLLSDFKDVSNFTMKLFDLSWNRLTAIDFSLAPKADKLDFSKNEIVSIENCDLLEANIVNLDSNNISFVNGTLNGLSEIYLSHNQLEILDSTLLTESKNLSIVDFSNNKIKFLDENLFQALYSLKEVHLEYNEIVKIDINLFQGLRNLKCLNLSNNKIENFQYGTFDSLTSLEILDISGNKLVDLNQHIFHSLLNLAQLDFSNNRISSFDAHNLGKYHQNLRSVSLNDNPWSCKDLINMKNVFKLFDVSVSQGRSFDVENVHGIACSNQKDVNSVNVSQFPSEKFVIDFQKTIDKSVENSKIHYFLNDDFKESKFVQYFDKDYVRSNFFKFLNDFKFVSIKPDANVSNAEKFTSVLMTPPENKVTFIQVFNAIILFALLLTVIFRTYLSVSKKKVYLGNRRPSDIQLV